MLFSSSFFCSMAVIQKNISYIHIFYKLFSLFRTSRPGYACNFITGGCFCLLCFAILLYNPIQNGGGQKGPPTSLFPCNFYKREDWSPKHF